uniref:Uncharacterized protein n=1 Tax=Amphimedon queenslandica TaxID=400682 RepID=A0A1X7TGP8_AMPQE
MHNPTKRQVLSIVSKIYDPIGFVSPVTICLNPFYKDWFVRKWDGMKKQVVVFWIVGLSLYLVFITASQLQYTCAISVRLMLVDNVDLLGFVILWSKLMLLLYTCK